MDERYRAERLEEQLADLTDLHNHALTNMQQELSSMEERLEYRSAERERDVLDNVDQCQTRVRTRHMLSIASRRSNA